MERVAEAGVNWESLVLVAATVVLVAITAFYARQTRRLVDQTSALVIATSKLADEARANRRPHIVASLHFFPPDYGELRLVNAGGSSAVNIAIRFWAVPSGMIRSWSNPLMEVADSANFRLLPGESSTRLPDFVRQYRSLHIKGRYSDVEGAEFEIDADVPVSEVWGNLGDAQQLVAARRETDRQIKAIEDIASELRKSKPTAGSS